MLPNKSIKKWNRWLKRTTHNDRETNTLSMQEYVTLQRIGVID